MDDIALLAGLAGLRTMDLEQDIGRDAIKRGVLRPTLLVEHLSGGKVDKWIEGDFLDKRGFPTARLSDGSYFVLVLFTGFEEDDHEIVEDASYAVEAMERAMRPGGPWGIELEPGQISAKGFDPRGRLGADMRLRRGLADIRIEIAGPAAVDRAALCREPWTDDVIVALGMGADLTCKDLVRLAFPRGREIEPDYEWSMNAAQCLLGFGQNVFPEIEGERAPLSLLFPKILKEYHKSRVVGRLSVIFEIVDELLEKDCAALRVPDHMLGDVIKSDGFPPWLYRIPMSDLYDMLRKLAAREISPVDLIALLNTHAGEGDIPVELVPAN